jgi:hypothetical protein
MTTVTREQQTLTQINPRRRMVAPAGAAAPPAFEVDDEPIADDDESSDDSPHPLTSYSNPNRVRWVPALCVIDEISIAKVRAWDAKEDALKIIQWRIIVQRHGLPEGGGRDAATWITELDQQRDPSDTFADLTRETIRDMYGPGKYRAWLYAAVEDDKTGVVGFPHRRCVRWAAGARTRAHAAAPAAPAPAHVEQPRTAPAPRAVPLALSSAPSSFVEEMQLLELKSRLAREEREAAERAEDRRIARAREEQAAADREDDRRRTRDREEAERRDREDDRRRTRDRDELDRRREEEDRARKRESDLEVRLLELKSKQLAGDMTPLAQLKSMREMMIEADGVFGAGKSSESGAGERIGSMLIESLSPQVPKVMEMVGQILTDREATNRALQLTNARIAEMEAHMRANGLRARIASPAAAPPPAPAAQHADPRVRVTQAPAQSPAPQAVPVSAPPAAAGPPAPHVEPIPITVAAPDPEPPPAVSHVPGPGLVELPLALAPDAPCPACGVANGCVHFPPDAEDEENDDDFCDKCGDACTHDESTFGPDGCDACPPCTHGDGE